MEGVGNEVKIVVDSDWAGCSQTRKSTNGGCIMVVEHDAKSRGFEQQREAEYCAAIKGASEGPWFLGFLAGCADLGIWTKWRGYHSEF